MFLKMTAFMEEQKHLVNPHHCHALGICGIALLHGLGEQVHEHLHEHLSQHNLRISEQQNPEWTVGTWSFRSLLLSSFYPSMSRHVDRNWDHSRCGQCPGHGPDWSCFQLHILSAKEVLLQHSAWVNSKAGKGAQASSHPFPCLFNSSRLHSRYTLYILRDKFRQNSRLSWSGKIQHMGPDYVILTFQASQLEEAVLLLGQSSVNTLMFYFQRMVVTLRDPYDLRSHPRGCWAFRGPMSQPLLLPVRIPWCPRVSSTWLTSSGLLWFWQYPFLILISWYVTTWMPSAPPQVRSFKSLWSHKSF